MKVMIFSVTAGQGHNTTARVLASALKERGHEVSVTDTFRTTNRLFYLMYDKGYLLASSRLKYFYGLGYYRCEGRKSNSYKTSLARIGYRSVAKKISHMIKENDPDVIITTHPIGSAVLDIVKERHGTRAKMIGVSTDFTMHPYWEDALRFDRVVIPSEHLLERARRKGFCDEQILPLGIPIAPAFGEKADKTAAREALGLPTDRPILLVMSGSMGYGRMDKTLKALSLIEEPFGIVAVCGRNERAHRLVERSGCKQLLLNLGFTDRISLLMDAADCIVSKPGGLTTSEALAKGLPMITVNPIPGQEVRNEELLSSLGVAIPVKTEEALREAVRTIFWDEEKGKAMQDSIRALRRPDSTARICDEIERICSQNKD